MLTSRLAAAPSRGRFRPAACRGSRLFACLATTGLFLAACSSGAGPAVPEAIASRPAPSKKTTPTASAQAFDAASTPELAAISATTGVPPSVTAALARARISPSQVSLLVAPADGGTPLVNLHTGTPMNPASVMKLVTTAAALDILGTTYTWRTPVWADGSLRDGTLRGNLYIQGQGDPKLVVERLWLLLQQVRQAGVHTIDGDLVLDNSAFDLPTHDTAAFDGEPLRPYNAAPDALLVNFKALTLQFTPDAGLGVARVGMTPPLAGVHFPPTLPLSDDSADCRSWQNSVKADFSDSRAITFAGSYPAHCGNRSWTLAEIIRDINKHSNNVMASQLFLTLGLQTTGNGSYESAHAAVQQWWRTRLGDAPPPQQINGSGLSRTARISASSLGAMLQAMWKSPVMSEFMASMPLAGIDGTLRRSRVRQPGSAHLKTGTLNDASALAGYVLANNGKYYVMVAMANGPGAPAARPAFEALVDWTMEQSEDLVLLSSNDSLPDHASLAVASGAFPARMNPDQHPAHEGE